MRRQSGYWPGSPTAWTKRPAVLSRLDTERLVSAVMKAGFGLKALLVVILGGGASVVKRNVSPGGLSASASISLRDRSTAFGRAFYLPDDKVNAEGVEGVLYQMSGREGMR